MPTALDKLNAKIFSEQLHTRFNVTTSGAEPMVLELFEVSEHETSPKMELFTLHFLGAATRRLPQQIHRLEHEKLGTLEIFLTAIGQDQDQRIIYESVFHRFRKPAPGRNE
jgi:Domain of unknown function (DUF6916)